jgi:ketol-acid reductoisomerase
MAKMIHDADVDLNPILSRRIAVIGYGSQGHAHALNLKDSGADVRVGVRPGSRGWKAAEKDGFTPLDPAAAAQWADVIMILVPDLVQPGSVQAADRAAPDARQDADVRARLRDPLRLDHAATGRRRLDGRAQGAGPSRREVFKEGAGVPGLVAIHNDATGNASTGDARLCQGHRLHARRRDRDDLLRGNETDLFGEQAVLCGGVSALVSAGFETLVEAGYQPEIAYFECLHELKLIVDLMYRGGLGFMRYSVSDTAEHGDYSGGPRIVTAETKAEMKKMLAEIRSGAYAEKLARETKSGWFQAERERQRGHQIEQVGARLRARMPFLEPVASPAPEPVAG